MLIEASTPIVWRIALRASAEAVFDHLTSDAARARYWAKTSRAVDGGFALVFPGGLETFVEVISQAPPRSLAIRYFDAVADFDLTRDGDGCVLRVTDYNEDAGDWAARYAGWVNWLLMFKASLDLGVDLRNGDEARTWNDGFADQ